MTKEEIYIAALDNCLGRKNDDFGLENCHKCPYFGMGCCQDELREGIACNTNPDDFIAAGLITEGYIKPYMGFTIPAFPYDEISLKPTEEKTQKVEWLNDIYFTIPEKETKYEVYDENNNIIYSATTNEDAEDYIKNLVIKVVTD